MQKNDLKFILEMSSKVFPYIGKYHKINLNVFYERFNIDYTERIILLIDNTKMGFYQLTKRNNQLLILGLFISKKYQKLGIAKVLMLYFEKIASKMGFSEIDLLVWENNIQAIKFYRKP